MPKLFITGLLAFIFFLLATGNIYAANLLQNSGFESSLGGEWSKSGGGATATTSAAIKRSGNYSLKVEHDKTGSYGFQQTVSDLEGGMFYEASVYAATTSTNVSAYFIRVAWYSSSDGTGSQMQAPNDSEKENLLTGEWTLLSQTVQAPVDAKSAKLRLVFNTTSSGSFGFVYFDDVVFREVSETPTPTPTPAPTKSPSPAPTKTPTPTPMTTSTPEPTPIELAMDQEEVLGISGIGEETPTPAPTEKPKASSTSPKGILFASLLVIAGVGLVGFSAYSFFAQRSASDRIEDYEEEE